MSTNQVDEFRTPALEVVHPPRQLTLDRGAAAPTVPAARAADRDRGVAYRDRAPGRRRRGRFSGLATTPTVLFAADVAAWGMTAAVFRGALLPELLLLLTVLAVHAGMRGYRARLSFSGLDQLPRLTMAAAAGSLVHLTATALANPYARVDSGLTRGLALWAALLVARSVSVAVIKAARRRRVVEHRTLVIGGGVVGRDLVTRLDEHPELGLRPVGVLDPDPPGGSFPVPWLGDVNRLSQVVQAEDVDVVVVAFSRLRESDLVDVLRTCDRLECEFFFVPRLFELQSVQSDMDEAWGMPLLRVRRAAFRTPAWRVKRMIDVVTASLMLLAVSPLMAAVGLAVRVEGGPGILFKQQRIGLDGRPFTMMKFRSMRPADDSESQTRWNVSQDDRVGPVGKVIRATSLDELPQLANVLRGDMSMVGPRPERPHFVDQFADRIPRYTGRHRVPAGLTGLAAVYGLRGDTSIEDRARIDNYYIENWSLWLDVKVVLRTAVAVLRRTGS